MSTPSSCIIKDEKWQALIQKAEELIQHCKKQTETTRQLRFALCGSVYQSESNERSIEQLEAEAKLLQTEGEELFVAVNTKLGEYCQAHPDYELYELEQQFRKDNNPIYLIANRQDPKELKEFGYEIQMGTQDKRRTNYRYTCNTVVSDDVNFYHQKLRKFGWPSVTANQEALKQTGFLGLGTIEDQDKYYQFMKEGDSVYHVSNKKLVEKPHEKDKTN
jgi:hypothetical protein